MPKSKMKTMRKYQKVKMKRVVMKKDGEIGRIDPKVLMAMEKERVQDKAITKAKAKAKAEEEQAITTTATAAAMMIGMIVEAPPHGDVGGKCIQTRRWQCEATEGINARRS